MKTLKIPIKSPCNGICDIEPRSGVCRSCRRTLDEIALWSIYSPSDRDRILGELPGRLVEAPRAAGRGTCPPGKVQN